MYLLLEPKRYGQPIEYIAARVRGKRSCLTTGWNDAEPGKLLPTDREAFSRHGGEAAIAWCYLAMEKRLQKIYAPFIFLYQIQKILICLRFKKINYYEKVRDLLHGCLLGNEMVDVLRQKTSIDNTVDRVVLLLSTIDSSFGQLQEDYHKVGLVYFEQQSMRLALQWLASKSLHAEFREFPKHFVDCWNLFIRAKELRWQNDGTTNFVNGGKIPPGKLEKIINFEGLMHVMESYGYGYFVPSAVKTSGLEVHLLSVITGKLCKNVRKGQFANLILDYLWRCYLQERNNRLFIYLAGEDPDAFKQEFIQ